jgi:tRNA threonylcarbamoyladenosine biosynthesis protein TsaE
MPASTIQISFTLADIQAAAHQLWQWAHGARVFSFSGSLGAGKTTFIHALCDMLGVKDSVSSPTFALINEYRYNMADEERTIYHMDWYRLLDAEEAMDAGMEDALNNSSAVCFVEWPEKAPELLHIPHVQVTLLATGEGERELRAVRID